MAGSVEKDAEQEVLDHEATQHTSDSLTMGKAKPFPGNIGDEDPYLVDFEGPDDPMHPYRWPLGKKLRASFALGLTTASVAFGSAIYAPAIFQIADHFQVSVEVATLGVALYVLGFAGGPVIWGSLSEYYGRKGPILLSQIMFICFSFASGAAENIQTLLITRFFTGFLGSAPFAVIGGAFTDMLDTNHRGIGVTGYLTMVFSAPLAAPVVGGFITESRLGWRWTQYISAFFGVLTLILDVFLYEESYLPMVLVAKARRLRRQTGNWAIHAKAEQQVLDFKSIVTKTISRPLVMLFTEPACFFVCLYVAFIYGILYMLLEAFPIIFITSPHGYQMSPAIGELPYLGTLVGMVFCTVYLVACEPRYLRISKQHGCKPVPSARLDAMVLPAIVFPIGIFMVTWTGNYAQHIPWIVPTIGGAFAGFGLLGIFVTCICYLVETYLALAASAIAANAFLRAAFAASFPLFSRQLFTNLGINWGGTLIGCIGVGLVPIPFMFKIYADKLKPRYFK